MAHKSIEDKRKYHREYNKKRYNSDLKWKEKHKETKTKSLRRTIENFLFKTTKWNAKKRNLDFSIDIEDIKIPEICPILKIPIVPFALDKNSRPSIDRIDNTKGYIKGNIAVISWRANLLKSDGLLEEFVNIVQYIKERINANW